jgi:hypothetical protein
MKLHITSVCRSLLLAVAALPHLAPAQEFQDKARERIGIYDSRAVAVAYAGSAFQVRKMQGLTTQLKKAREAGDAKEVSRLEAEGKEWQATLHQQGFGTAPVDDILTNIASDLPKIREAAGVTALVSRWNQAELGNHPRAEQVDVTMKLVDAFHPTAKQRKYAIEIQKKSPAKAKE